MVSSTVFPPISDNQPNGGLGDVKSLNTSISHDFTTELLMVDVEAPKVCTPSRGDTEEKTTSSRQSDAMTSSLDTDSSL